MTDPRQEVARRPLSWVPPSGRRRKPVRGGLSAASLLRTLPEGGTHASGLTGKLPSCPPVRLHYSPNRECPIENRHYHRLQRGACQRHNRDHRLVPSCRGYLSADSRRATPRALQHPVADGERGALSLY